MTPAEKIIAHLQLQPHPEEGGFFRETFRSGAQFGKDQLPSRYSGPRSHSTAIYYMLTPETFSALHRLETDEVFHFYAGNPIVMLQLSPDGSGKTITLGDDLFANQMPQVVVPRGVWQGSRLVEGGNYALMGCTVAPGFDYDDYEHGNRSELIAKYPNHAEWIRRLTTAG